MLVVVLILVAVKNQELFGGDVDLPINLSKKETKVRDFIFQSLRKWEPLEFGYDDRNISASRRRESVHSLALTKCPWPKYIPRVMSTNQVSWKVAEDYTKSSGDNDIDAIEQPLDLAGGKGPSSTSADKTIRGKTFKNSEGDTIHRYLVFALVLPEQDYSLQLQESLRIIAPLYSNVTTIIGNALEFQDFCHQYNVKSYPKVLFFQMGQLKAKFSVDIHTMKTSTAGLFNDKVCDTENLIAMNLEKDVNLDISLSGGYTPEVLSIFYTRWSNDVPIARPIPYHLNTAGWNGRSSTLSDIIKEMDFGVSATRDNTGSIHGGNFRSQVAAAKVRRLAIKQKLRNSAVLRKKSENMTSATTASYISFLRIPVGVRLWWSQHFQENLNRGITYEPGLAIMGPEYIIDAEIWLAFFSAVWVLYRLYHSWRMFRGVPSDVAVLPFL